MEFKKWIKGQYRLFRRFGPQIWPLTLRDLFSFSCRVTGRTGKGSPVYERDWDILVLLDACRHDLYTEVVRDCDLHRSPASMSMRFMEKTFSDKYSEEMANTAYITANPFSEQLLNSDDFALLDEVWSYAWDDELNTVLPNTMTDRAIDVIRNRDDNRVIVHYMQPHLPFIADGTPTGEVNIDNFGGDMLEANLNIWEEVSLGLREKEIILEEYRENLAYVMDSVEILLNNADGTVVISSDHGNALGEYGLWGHPQDIPISALRDVPWDIHQCTDSGSYNSTISPEVDAVKQDVEDRLTHLGYK